MDGNFVDNDFSHIIDSASVLPLDYKDVTSKKKPVNPRNKYDKFAMRIQFSSDLDPSSVNSENAVLMSADKKVNATVQYDKNRKSIVISPKNKYLRDRLYVLKISGKVMSDKGRSLRKNRFFAFKQDGKTLNFYKGLEFQDGNAPERLNFGQSYILPMMFLFSSLLLVFSYLYGNRLGLVIGTVFVMLATFFALIDSVSDIGKSQKECFYGAKLYNQGFYYEAIECFELALHYNTNNPFAKYGLDAAIIKSSEADD